MGSFLHFFGGQSKQTDLEAFQSPLVWFDFTDADSLTLTGSALDVAANKGTGGSGYDLTHNSGVQATITGGEAVCNGSQNDYRSGSAGDYDFLHNGDGGHTFYVIEHDSADTGENFLHITNITSSNAAGSRFTSQQTSDQNLYRSITGLGGSNLTNASASNTLPEDVYTIAEHTIKTETGTNDIIMRDDGVELVSVTDGGLLTATSHADPARFLVSGACKVKGILVFDKRLTDAERYAVYRKAASYYSLPTMNVSMIIGDSNAGMQNAAASLSSQYAGVIPKAYTWAHEGGNAANELAFWPTEANLGAFDATSSNAGPELSYAYTVAQATGEKEYILKSYENGSDLYAKWNPTDFPELSSGWDAFAEKVAAVKAYASSMGRSITWRGCWQILGHNDCSATFRSNSYQGNLADLNADIRELTRSDLPIVVTVTSLEGLNNPDAGFTTATYQSTVRGAINTVGNTESNTYAWQPEGADTSTLAYNETTPDGVHYNITVMEDMGEDVGEGITATSAPVVSTAPTIDTPASTTLGAVLTLKAGIWTNGLLEAESIQWKRDGSAISGATGWQYTLVEADDGTDITCTFTPKNIAGSGTETTTAAVSINYDASVQAGVPSAVFDLDATNSDSWNGSDGIWHNIVASPADGASQTDYDFANGSGTGADSNDMTFNGSVGDQAAYFTKSDTADRFTLNGSNTTFINNMAIANATDWWIGGVIQRPVGGALESLFQTQGATNGIDCRILNGANTGLMQLLQEQNNVLTAQNNNTAALAEGSPVAFIISRDESTNTVKLWLSSDTQNASFVDAYNAGTNASDNPARLFTSGDTGSRYYHLSGGNGLIDDTLAAAWFDIIEARHGRTYR